MSQTHIFGIRHHGPGSARSLLRALERLQPDILLIEGPPDANAMIPFITRDTLQPPVSLLVYASEDTSLAAFFPFAVFSPEYQAMRYALAHHIPVQFMDLPQTYNLKLQQQKREEVKAQSENPPSSADDEPTEEEIIRLDPLGELAKAAGYEDGERWWEHMVEQRQDETGLFEALIEALGAVREKIGELDNEREPLREAYMRQTIRTAQSEGYQRIAVVCGAWHAPALNTMPDEQADAALLDNLETIETTATWIPWTHRRLSRWSGYGAGVNAPGWYHYLWTTEEDLATGWLTRVAHLLRNEQLDASTAQVIDAVRLAETLAAIRSRPMPGLEEFNEAALTIFCFGNDVPMQIIADKLIIGDEMGTVPDDVPMVPLQRNLNQQLAALRLSQSTAETTLKLDLRNEFHLERSQLLHRLWLLEVNWGEKEIETNTPGTFKELWYLQWLPEYNIKLIEKSEWGSTLKQAATEYTLHLAEEAKGIPDLTRLVNLAILAHLPEAIPHVVHQLGDHVALSGDVLLLMQGLPALARVSVYSDIRETDVAMVDPVIDSMITRTCIGLPSECANMNDEAAREMFDAMISFHHAIVDLNRDHDTQRWYRVLKALMVQQSAHGIVRGRACRILVEAKQLSVEEMTQTMRFALSRMSEPANAANWLTGFLEGGGLILLHHDTLLLVINRWVVSLKNEIFEAILPLLRRTFASFTEQEVMKIGRAITHLSESQQQTEAQIQLDADRAKSVLPMFAQLLGLDDGEETHD